MFERHREYFEAVRNWKKDWEEYNYTEVCSAFQTSKTKDTTTLPVCISIQFVFTFLLQEMRKKPEALANRGGILLVYEKRMKELRKNLARIQQAIAAYVSTNSGSLYSLLHERFLNCSIPQISTHAFYV